MEVVVTRPPLVYGPGVKANFAALMRAVQRGWPLPLGAVHNQRSLVALDNLVDSIVTCITHPQAANQTFLVSDGQDLSTTELVRGMAQAARWCRRGCCRCRCGLCRRGLRCWARVMR
jgi:nucleoside-diphosphate-sugar epimerase